MKLQSYFATDTVYAMSTWVTTSDNNLKQALKEHEKFCLEKDFISDGHLLMLGIHGK